MESYPLANAQKRIWYAQKKYGAGAVFNIGGRVLIKGNANLNLLARSFQILIEQNDALRIRFTEKNGGVFQIVSEESGQVDILDFSQCEDVLQQCEEWCDKKAKEPFVMTGTPLYYFCVFKLSENLTGYFVKFHHIIADGWSIELMTEQIADNYACVSSGKEPKSVRPSYVDHVTCESTLTWEKESAYWEENAAMLSEMSIAASSNLESKRKSFILDSELQKRISVFIKQRKITWNVFFIGLLQIYQYKKTGHDISSTGIPFWGRSSKQERMTFGTFTNTLPFCYRLEANWSVDEHYAALTKELKIAYGNQCYPVDLLAQKIQVGKREGLLYHTCINYYNTYLTHTLGGFPLENSEFHRGCQEQPLQVIVRNWDGNQVQLDFDYQIALYSERQIQDMYDQWILLIEQITTDPSKQISSLSLVSNEDKQKLINISINKIKEPAVSWIQRLNDWVISTPDVVAVSQDQRSWTYAQLYNELAQRIAYYKESGIQKGDIVMAALSHEMKSVAAIYAIILCGAVYLPVSPDWPIERIKEIQQDCQARFLVSDSVNLPDIRTLSLEYETKELIPHIGFTIPDGEDIAYIIYTSGSTGKPKGAMIRHRSLNCYLQWANATYSKTQHEVHALFSAFTFDFTITALFVPVMCGGEIRIYPSTAGQPNVFENILKENRVTVLKITPSHIGLIQSIKHQNHSIHTFVIGGEDLKTQSCRMLLKKFKTTPRIFNEYGPTEATVGYIVHEYNAQTDKDVSVPIGKPIAGARAFLFDKDGNLLPHDTKAELILGGEGLTCGYCNSAGDSEKFIQNALLPGETLYRTGDLAYVNKQGIYIYCGRIDDELKIRGYRINPSELECKAMESEMVLEAAAKAVTIQGSTNVFLYVVSNERYQEKEFSEWLAQRLPGYMQPRGIVKLDSLPLTAHGKVDKSRLPEWKPIQEDTITVPQTPEEELLFSICKELLPHGVDINADSNFYALGGDSIKAIQISSRILEHGYELQVPDILINPILREMAKCIIQRQEIPDVETVSGEPFEGLPIVQWFFDQDFAEPGQYNQSVVLRLKHSIHTKHLEKVLSVMVVHHDSLRINKTPEGNRLFYNPIHLDQPVKITEIKTKSNGWENIEPEIRPVICTKFNLEKDLLFRVYLVHAHEEQYLLFIFHHLIIDAVSWQIFLHDLSSLLEKWESGADLTLPGKTVSYAWISNKYHAQNKETFPSKQQKTGTYGDRVVINEIFDNEILCRIADKANIPYGTKPHELIIMALAIALIDCRDDLKEKIIFEIELHGRDAVPDLDMSRTIGWFTKICPIVIDIPNESLSKQIIGIKEQIRHFEKNKHKKLSCSQTYMNEIVYRKVRVNYMGDLAETENRYWTLTDLSADNDVSPRNQMSCDMDISLYFHQGSLYVTAAFQQVWRNKGHTILACWFKHLKTIIVHCLERKKRIYTPSDYEMVDLSQDELNILLKNL